MAKTLERATHDEEIIAAFNRKGWRVYQTTEADPEIFFNQGPTQYLYHWSCERGPLYTLAPAIRKHSCDVAMQFVIDKLSSQRLYPPKLEKLDKSKTNYFIILAFRKDRAVFIEHDLEKDCTKKGDDTGAQVKYENLIQVINSDLQPDLTKANGDIRRLLNA